MDSPWTSPFVVQAHDRVRHACMVHVTTLDIQVRLRNPTAMLEDSMTSVKTLYLYNSYLSTCHTVEEVLLWSDAGQEPTGHVTPGSGGGVIGQEGGQGAPTHH